MGICVPITLLAPAWGHWHSHSCLSLPLFPQLVLNSSHLLTPQDVQCLASGLCPAQPDAAQAFLQEAVDKRRSRSGQTSGHLVLVLDKVSGPLPEACPCQPSLCLSG
ncbi:Separin [Platysternon megacephalum]|uniref:Separin n=1 Tax=Platysternon megacephalum TaxID=55544 RepID=A0A4D9DJ42_9SAUR|nr:Separin [Platysternon megacephalum]